MKKVLAGSFAAALLAVGVSAPDADAAQNPPMQEAAKDAAKTLTVTGCLKAGDTPDSFTLSDLKWKDDKAVGTSGATAPAAPPVAATSLKLIPSASTKLGDHVGHTVEVSGTIGDKAGERGRPERSGGPPRGERADRVERPQRADGLRHLLLRRRSDSRSIPWPARHRSGWLFASGWG